MACGGGGEGGVRATATEQQEGRNTGDQTRVSKRLLRPTTALAHFFFNQQRRSQRFGVPGTDQRVHEGAAGGGNAPCKPAVSSTASSRW